MGVLNIVSISTVSILFDYNHKIFNSKNAGDYMAK